MPTPLHALSLLAPLAPSHHSTRPTCCCVTLGVSFSAFSCSQRHHQQTHLLQNTHSTYTRIAARTATNTPPLAAVLHTPNTHATPQQTRQRLGFKKGDLFEPTPNVRNPHMLEVSEWHERGWRASR